MTEIKLSITFKAETSRIYLLCELEGGSVADYHRPKRPNGLSRKDGGYWRVGRVGFQRKSGRSHLDYLARYTTWTGLTSFFLRFPLTFTSTATSFRGG